MPQRLCIPRWHPRGLSPPHHPNLKPQRPQQAQALPQTATQAPSLTASRATCLGCVTLPARTDTAQRRIAPAPPLARRRHIALVTLLPGAPLPARRPFMTIFARIRALWAIVRTQLVQQVVKTFASTFYASFTSFSRIALEGCFREIPSIGPGLVPVSFFTFDS